MHTLCLLVVGLVAPFRVQHSRAMVCHLACGYITPSTINEMLLAGQHEFLQLVGRMGKSCAKHNDGQ